MNNNFFNLIAAVVLSVLIIFGWQYFYEKPRLAELARQNQEYKERVQALKSTGKALKVEKSHKLDKRDEAITTLPRVQINSGLLNGSISLRGFRLDDLVLNNYRQDVNSDSDPVALLSPTNYGQAYFAELGWIGERGTSELPGPDSIWQADKSQIIPNDPVTFRYKNNAGVEFVITVVLDDNYLFTIEQRVNNNSSAPVEMQYYGLLNRSYDGESERMMNILHQGMIGAADGQLQEYTYEKMKEEKKVAFADKKINWLGITDKYWLTAFIPDQSEQYLANYSYAIIDGEDKYQADFLSPNKVIKPGESLVLTHHLFAGAKKVDLLDHYEAKYNIPLFDRAIDFGWFYVLTKPIFNAMNFFYHYVGNFGISIMIVTVTIKLLMFSLANKSYRSMKKMKKLQPALERIKELYADDKTRLNQEVMQLYKREKVNPVSGCLPLLVQIPVFFSIYKVLYVTIEMRHAPFFGWIKDLSAPDPTTLFNLFGLLPFNPPSFLMIGVWPIIMAITMFMQQRLSPAPADPVQAQVMKFMPLMFLFMFSSFPAGLLIYWSWNNILSIVQQFYINKLDKQPE